MEMYAVGKQEACAKVIPASQHPFYTLFLLTDGSCEFHLDGEHLILILGDLLIAAPGQQTAMRLTAGAHMLQCQFVEETSALELNRLLDLHAHRSAYQQSEIRQRLRELRVFEVNPAEITRLRAGIPANLQYLTHLNQDETGYIQALLDKILCEQVERLEGAEQMKRTYLQQLLVLLIRMRLQQFAVNKTPLS